MEAEFGGSVAGVRDRVRVRLYFLDKLNSRRRWSLCTHLESLAVFNESFSVSTLSIQYDGGTLVMCKPPGRTRELPLVLPSARPAAAMLAFTAAAMSAVDRGAATSWSRDLFVSHASAVSCCVHTDHHGEWGTCAGLQVERYEA